MSSLTYPPSAALSEPHPPRSTLLVVCVLQSCTSLFALPTAPATPLHAVLHYISSILLNGASSECSHFESTSQKISAYAKILALNRAFSTQIYCWYYYKPLSLRLSRSCSA
eukprot:IDg6605t1